MYERGANAVAQHLLARDPEYSTSWPFVTFPPWTAISSTLRRFVSGSISKNIFIRRATANTALTNAVPDKALKIPIAHGEGRFHADAATLKALKDNDQVIFRYCDAEGRIIDTANPNGSKENIAGVCNKERNVFGMMPHPERMIEAVQGERQGASVQVAVQYVVRRTQQRQVAQFQKAV